MDRRTQLVLGMTSQTLTFYPPEWVGGAPSSAATVQIWAGDMGNDGTPEITGTATADPLSLTLDAASGYSQTDRRKINLTSTSNAVARRPYIIQAGTTASVQRELVKLVKIVANDYVQAEWDLAYDYAATTSYLAGFGQALALSDDWMADESNLNEPECPYRVEWRYTIAGVAYRHFTYFDLVRHPRQCSVAGDDLYAIASWLKYAQAADRFGEDYRSVIDEAHEQVRDDLRDMGVEPTTVLGDADTDRLVVYCTLSILGNDHGLQPPGVADGSWGRARAAIYMRKLAAKVAGLSKLRHTEATGDGSIVTPLTPFRFR